jgi:hypothetical protein
MKRRVARLARQARQLGFTVELKPIAGITK